MYFKVLSHLVIFSGVGFNRLMSPSSGDGLGGKVQPLTSNPMDFEYFERVIRSDDEYMLQAAWRKNRSTAKHRVEANLSHQVQSLFNFPVTSIVV